ncbi:MAG: TolC family protein [Pseudomonadota bacterium]
MKRNVPMLITCLFLLLLWANPSGIMAQEYSLDDLYQVALQRAEKIKISEENILIAEAGKSKAMSYLLPRLTTFANFADYTEAKYGHPGTIPTPVGNITLPGSLIQPHTAGAWGIRLDESLSLGGREFTSLKISEENLEKNRLDTYAVKEDYLLAVALAYYNVLKAGKNLDIAEANVERLSTYRTAADKRFRIGEVTRTVLLRAQAELSGALSDRMTAQNILELATANLKRIVGLKDAVRLKAEPFSTPDITPVETYVTTALAERSDLKSLEIQKKLAARQVRYASGAHWPSLSVSGVYSGLDQSPAASTINRESIYAGVSLNFPIFEGGLRLAEVKEARSREKQSGLHYDDLKNTIGIEVQAAYLDLMTHEEALKFLEDQLVFARDNFQAVARQFEFGLAHSIDVMDANTLLVSAERKVSDAAYNYQIAVMRMKKATGVLLKEILAKN